MWKDSDGTGRFRLLLGVHLARDVDAGQAVGGVRTDGDGFLEMAGHFSFAVVGDVDLTLFAGFDGRLGIIGYGAAARRDGLLDDKGLVAGVFKDELIADRLLLGEMPEVVLYLFKLDDSLR